ncbi:hypothetical protein [Ancylobacter sp.]|uniref:hypothetical protein n=1 Tax=Ancylobacter sp. TaxID=1872567 RepID=UPI003D13489A
MNTPAAFTPPLRLTVDGETADIATLDAALIFAERHPRPKGDYEGLIRRLQGAHSEAQKTEAADAFRWWAESNALFAPA